MGGSRGTPVLSAASRSDERCSKSRYCTPGCILTPPARPPSAPLGPSRRRLAYCFIARSVAEPRGAPS
eukprot:3499792-Prymnesium_polylepis.1